MNYDKELQFAQKLLSNYSLDVRYITTKPNAVFSSQEMQPHLESLQNLHESLQKMWNPENLLTLLQQEFHANTIYQIHDVFTCNYFIFQLPGAFETPLYVYIGPYTTAPISKEKIHSITNELQFQPKALAQIEQFCLAAPLIADENILLTILYTLGESIWGSIDNFSLQVVENPFLPNVDMLLADHIASPIRDSLVDLEVSEERYKPELLIMQAISAGQTHKAELYLSHLLNQQYSSRITNTLRQLKNYVLALNTLFRMAALNSVVHPYQVNQLSLRYATDIEQIQTTNDAITQIREMLRQYCLLVKNHSLKVYSPLIQKVLTLIDFDLTADLTLNALAETVKVNPCYLSSLFKKETGETLTEHVNRKRIERAIFLLNSTNLQIQEIAKLCGIPDVNYFTKKFKKLIGKTPKEYRNDILYS